LTIGRFDDWAILRLGDLRFDEVDFGFCFSNFVFVWNLEFGIWNLEYLDLKLCSK